MQTSDYRKSFFDYVLEFNSKFISDETKLESSGRKF